MAATPSGGSFRPCGTLPGWRPGLFCFSAGSPLIVDDSVLVLHVCVLSDLLMLYCSVEHCCDVLHKKIYVSLGQGSGAKNACGKFTWA